MEAHPRQNDTEATRLRKNLRSLCLSALVAALYAALTLLLQPISYGAVQFRVSEALTLLPALLPQAIPGLGLGCFLANLLGGNGPWDLLVGTLATLLAALLTRRLRGSLWLAALPPILCNALRGGPMLAVILPAPLWPTVLTVGAGEAAVVLLLGAPLAKGLQAAHLPEKWQ